MIINIFLIALLLCFLSTLFFKKSFVLEMIALGSIAFFMGRGANTADTVNYRTQYKESVVLGISDTYEHGYLLLQKIGNYCGLDYLQFRIIIVLASLLLIRATILKLGGNVNYVYFFYLLFGVFIDTVQVRNFYALSIVLLGIRYLIRSQRLGTYKFIFFVFAAATIHISAIFYLILVLVKRRYSKVLIRGILFFTVVGCGVIFIMGNRVPFLNDIMLSFEEDKLTYYTKTTTNFGFLYPMVLTSLNTFWVYIAYKISRSQESKNLSAAAYKSDMLLLIFWINITAVIFFPFYMYNVQFIRLGRNLIWLDLLACSLVQVPIWKVNYKISFLNIGLAVTMIFWFYYTFIVQPHIEDVIIPFFDVRVINV